VHFVVAIRNTTNRGPNHFTCSGKNKAFALNENLTWYRLWYLCGDLCDMLSTVCWPKSKQIFQEMVGAPSYLEQTRWG